MKKANVKLTSITNRRDHIKENRVLIYNAYTAEDASSKSLYVCQSGMKKWRSPGWISGPAIYDHYIIHFLIDGKGTYFCKGKEYPIEAGNVFLIEPYTEVSYCADMENPYQYYWVGFNGLDCYDMLKRCGFSSTELVINTYKIEKMTALMDAIANTRSNTLADQYHITGCLYQIFGHLTQLEEETEHPNSKYYNDAIAFIQEHACMTTITATDVAAHIGVERSHLYRIFKENGQFTVKEVILAVRMKNAKTFLTNTDQSIEYVANCSGFKNTSHFCQTFRKIEGISPYQYRQREKKQSL